MTATVEQAPTYPFKSRKIAMLVIHGIGEQNPYETLDSFARGVFRHLNDALGLNITLESVRIALENWTQVGMRITVNPGKGSDVPGQIDIFEYYWAPATEDKLSWKDTLEWLIRTDLTPLRYFADNLQEMVNARMAGVLPALWYSLKLYARELLRVVLLYLPFAAALLWLLKWLSNPRAIWQSLPSISSGVGAFLVWPKSAALWGVLGCYILAILLFWFMLQFLGEYVARGERTVQKVAARAWFVFAFLCGLGLLVSGFALSSWSGIELRQLLNVPSGLQLLRPLAAIIAAMICRYLLTAYVADIAVYVTSDAKSKNYAARSEILNGSTAALKRILTNESYEHVVLAGHSLGSVIAYDTINELLAQFNAAPGRGPDQPSVPLSLPQLQKLKGLLTFGSPLDKIYYFFREHVKEDQAIRAQILSMLHSFRKTPSGRDYAPFEFTYQFRQLDGLIWVNAYSPADPVSGRLKFYMLNDEDQRSFWYWIPGLAHLRYWGDARFYSYFIPKLL